ncbi:aminodeoxychorismate/anthranilate synthase component II [Glaciecola sp. KUL10]|uniref:anthranilate synthase component II n=1 Tax=Glaciecola sp. (strain KUL10) TaxID=2161813 RepID=UPI000D787E29|nr:aminodeoxychorismate/anthranilate synthase component II [Glaciecola sp. KUL10]GBL03748.1 P-aminobenzoate synthetase, component II [Glaciecola sp. KUL10]
MVVIIDNYDSFTHNLARYFEELNCQVCVFKNDELSVDDIARFSPTHLVISPGPCTPARSGISIKAIDEYKGKIPILGVCLGHQAIGELFGARLINAPIIRHGKTSKIEVLSQTGLFKAIPEQFSVTRYHSLILEEISLAKTELKITAVCTQHGQKEVMAIEHAQYPIYGVQFHPESLLSEYGHEILQNFIEQ